MLTQHSHCHSERGISWGLATRIKPTEKQNLALDDLELLFNPETAQLSEFGI